MKKLKKILNKILIIIIIAINLIVFSAYYENKYIYATSLSDGGDIGTQIAQYALQFVGVTPYVHGGVDLINGADCSGFVSAIYGKFGYSVTNSCRALQSVGTEVSWENIVPGDVIIIPGSGVTGLHTGIYYGNGEYVHCSTNYAPLTLAEVGNDMTKTQTRKTKVPVSEIITIRRIVGSVLSDGSTPDMYPDDSSGPGLFHDFKPQGEIDQKEVDLDAKIFEFAGNPSRVEYTNPTPVKIQWLFSKLSQFVDYILGIAIAGLKGAVVGWTSIIESWINSAFRLLSGG